MPRRVQNDTRDPEVVEGAFFFVDDEIDGSTRDVNERHEKTVGGFE